MVLIAPSVAPGSFKVKQGYSISQLEVSWSAISDAAANGILLGYKLKYTITQISGQPVVGALTTKEFVLDKFTFFYKITGLQSYTTYSVSVSGFTGGGEGPFTTPILASKYLDVLDLPQQSFCQRISLILCSFDLDFPQPSS